MLFNSIEFAIFLPVVFILYWIIPTKNNTLKNILLLVSSYFFYGWWDWRFLSLIFISTIVDFSIGLNLNRCKSQFQRKILLLLSISVNLGFLGFFKYYNFFVESFTDAFQLFGKEFTPERLKIILPVGISFYTFQTLSYTIDVYNKKLMPTKNIVNFFAFVSFFPQLVAGPIERASNLLPQFARNHSFEYYTAVDGLRQILWGLFKKVVVADNCATYVNDIFANYSQLPGSTLLLGAIFFAFQIYGDFSGYSDIAIGTARLFGFNLMRNFAYPYFSRDIAEFWRRWHISLTTWFRDYIYIPLGGSRTSQWKKTRNVFIIFLVSGFWHGANWTFIAWGLINAIYFLPLLYLKKNRKNVNKISEGRFLPNARELIQIGITFLLVVIAWVLFRAENIKHALDYYNFMFIKGFFVHPGQIFLFLKEIFKNQVTLFIGLLVILEWIQRNKQHALQFESYKIPFIVRWGTYLFFTFLILYNGSNHEEFIYFQF